MMPYAAVPELMYCCSLAMFVPPWFSVATAVVAVGDVLVKV